MQPPSGISMIVDNDVETQMLKTAAEACQLVQDLSNLALAVLLSLIIGDHSLIRVPQMDSPAESRKLAQLVGNELFLICNQIFRLRTRILECTSALTIPHLLQALTGQDSPTVQTSSEDVDIPNILILSGLDSSSNAVQRKVADILLRRQIVTHTDSPQLTLPSLFVIIGIASDVPTAQLQDSKSRPWLQPTLADVFCFSHFHSLEDGFHFMEKEQQAKDRRSTFRFPIFRPSHILSLTNFSNRLTNISDEIRTYIRDLVVFLRLHPAFATDDKLQSPTLGVGPSFAASRSLTKLSLALAAVHGLTYIPPALVRLAFEKVYSHRMQLAQHRDPTSAFEGAPTTHTDVIDEILNTVTVPI